jgi:Uma2 family endonuclease
MTQLLHPSPFGTAGSLRRFTVDEYHRMIQTGILDETDRVELLDGFVVLKMPRNPPHDSTIQRLQRQLYRVLPQGWDLRTQSAITLSESEPEPDLAVVRGEGSLYTSRHPGAGDVAVVIEVADSSLDRDRLKGRVYAAAGIAVYWIVNLVDRHIEEYSLPSPASVPPHYAGRQDYPPGSSVSLVVGGVACSLLVVDLLP